MKIWWPWRKKKFQSLFEERVPWAYEDPNAPPPRFKVGLGLSEEPHPRNAPGPFYVAHGWCLFCGYPEMVAPDLIASGEAENYGHCYFRKQPETPAEIEQAIKAIAGCCCGAYRYAGSDPTIQQKLREAGEGDAIVQD